MSNWELRPLRQSQMHYAALDAACLPPIFKNLIVEAQSKEHAAQITTEAFTKPLIFGQKLETPNVFVDKDPDKKDNKKDRKKRKRGPRRKKDDRESAANESESLMEEMSSIYPSEEEKKHQ